MSLRGTPSTSAAIWASTVSAPVPRSVAPTRRLNEPSSFNLMLAPPISRNGMAVPCMQKAKPRPRRICGRSAGSRHSGSFRLCQETARIPWATHSSIPLDPTTGYSSSSPSNTAVSPRCGAMFSSSPTLTQFCRRNSMGSILRLSAMSSMWDSKAKRACGAP